MRKVLFIGLLPPHPGGAAMWTGGLLPRLAERGHEIVAIGPGLDGVAYDDDALARAGIAVERYPIPYFDTDPFANTDGDFYETQWRGLRALVSDHLNAGWADVLLAGTMTFLPGLLPLLREGAPPTIAMLHTIYWADDEARREAHFGPGGSLENLRACDQVVCVAGHAEARLTALGLTGAVAIPNAVDTALFRPRPRPRALADTLGIAAGTTVVAHAANLKPVKQAWRLIEAAPAILRRHPDTVFLLMGEGPCEVDLRQRRAALGLERHVRFLGWVAHERMPDHYALADAMVLPSASEAAPFAYLEALACGCPVVATPIEAAREFLTDMPGAHVARSHEPADIADAVCRALARGRDGRAETARTAAARYDLNEAADRFSSLIESVGRRT